MSLANLGHHLEALLLKFWVAVEAVGSGVGQGQQEHGADAGARCLIRRGGDEITIAGREGRVFHVSAQLAMEVLPLRLLSVEGPELEVGDLLATSGRGEEKPAVDGGVDDVVYGLLSVATGAVRRLCVRDGD